MTPFIDRITSRWSSPVTHDPIDDEWREPDMVSHRETLARQWLRGDGIEIGALHCPVPLESGVTVRYVDYKSKTENRARYPELAAHQIVDTDIIDDGFLLNSVAPMSVDFIVANHALEHSPDPYGTLLRWKSKLRRQGLIYFALPIADKCYDQGREITTLKHFLDDHRLFGAGRVEDILRATELHLREFLRVSDANIRRLNGIDHILDEAEIDEACQKLMAKLTAETSVRKLGGDDLIAMHVQHLNKTYDLHYHTFSATSLQAFAAHFCGRERCELVELRKSGNGECIVIVRNR